MTGKTHENDNHSPIGGAAEPDKTRRHLLKAGTLAGGALLLSAPHIRNAGAAQGQVQYFKKLQQLHR